MRKNVLLSTDSYKISHHLMYPEDMDYMYDYGEAREGGKWREAVFFGMQIFIKEYLLIPFTKDDLEEARAFYANHFLPVYEGKVFDYEMFKYILEEHGGYFPVRIKAVPEGMVIPESNVLYTIESTDPRCASVVSFLETALLRAVWYGTTVATNSYQMKKTIKEFGESTSDDLSWMPFALHDFGARGVSSSESALIGGGGHLSNFMGSDTIEAIYGMQKLYGVKEGLPGYSVHASEHSVMGSRGRDGEFDVVRDIFKIAAKPGGIFSIVNDTYDMEAHVTWVCENLKDELLASGARWVTRPDSGNPSVSVLTCLDILWKYFGGTINSKGYKVLNPCVRVIQGDGINADEVYNVLVNVMVSGFSTENVVFGSGGGLLQQVNRDTLRFAQKASYIEVNGEGRDIFKEPKTDTTKKSKKGKISLYRYNDDSRYITLAEEEAEKAKGWVTEVLVPVYENGKLLKDYTLDEVRANTCLW